MFLKRVAKTKVKGYVVSTTKVGDEYETAIKCRFGKGVVVQRYVNRRFAQIGHDHWVEFCEHEPLYATDIKTGEPTLL